MTHAISRMYATSGQAASAKAALEEAGYNDVHLVSGDNAGASMDDIVAAITKGYVLKSDARVYAVGVSKGGSLVTVHTLFGRGLKAERILDKFQPIDSGIAAPASAIMPWDEATPMSCVMQMPVLWNDPMPLSRFWNVPPLTAGSFSLSKMLGLPLLKKSVSSTTSFGLPLLSSKATPLSSLFGLPTLIKSRSSWR